MTVNVYDIGDEPKLSATFTQDDVATNPTAVACQVKRPDGGVDAYIRGDFSNQGAWSAAANSPALADGSGTAGHYYVVSEAGSVDFGNGDIDFVVGDWVFFNGDVWKRLPAPGSVNLSQDGIGIFSITVHVTQRGRWWYRFEGIGDGQAAGEAYFAGKRSQF